MYKILDSLVRMLAPILVHTAEEVWASIKIKSENVESVHLARMPAVDERSTGRKDEAKWEKIMQVRNDCSAGSGRAATE